MDFGDILDAWDKQTAQAIKVSKVAKKGNTEAEIVDESSTADDPELRDERAVDPLTAWLRINGVENKDAESLDNDRRRAGERRRRLLSKRADASLDLHGLTRDEAWLAMETFFQTSRTQGAEKLLLVHGKGNHSEGDAILKRTVRQFIENCPFAGESGVANAENGGNGATWVLLKGEKPESRKEKV
ncbi:DNA mismatch repair protein MutS [Spirochaetia bacterium]|nr:DNA mismatch repair protein MutS [Spirochaetia bacterium]